MNMPAYESDPTSMCGTGSAIAEGMPKIGVLCDGAKPLGEAAFALRGVDPHLDQRLSLGRPDEPLQADPEQWGRRNSMAFRTCDR